MVVKKTRPDIFFRGRIIFRNLGNFLSSRIDLESKEGEEKLDRVIYTVSLAPVQQHGLTLNSNI